MQAAGFERRGLAGALALVGVLLTAWVASGCAGSAQPSNPFDSRGSGAESVRVNVVNNNFNEATLRAIYRTERRLGVVSGNSEASFDVPWLGVNDLRIRIDILAGDSFTTNRISASPGETLFLTIERPLHRSWLRR